MQVKQSYYSIIDIGSNTMRLVIYSQEESLRLEEVENVKAVARLRNYLDADNMLSTEGIEKLLQTLKSFHKVVETYKITDFVCAATATIRQARNQQEIIDRVYKEIGWNLRILSEKEEAYYGYLSVVNSTTIQEGITVDIGGGSTEITYFKNRKLVKHTSFPFGGLTLKQFFPDDKPTVKQISKLQYYLKKEFHKLNWLKGKSVPLIAIGGSARNLVQVYQNLIEYPLAGLHQFLMTEENIVDTCQYLTTFSEKDLEKVEGLSKDRADTIISASYVFLTLFQTIQAEGFILSRKGLRDGVFYEKLANNSKSRLYPNVLEDSILELVYEYELNPKQINHVTNLTEKILHELIANRIGGFESNDWINIERGCYVYNLGHYIDSESSSQHTFYLLANRTIDGLMHLERLELAFLASFKNKTVFKQYMAPYSKWFSKEKQNKLSSLGALLKFIYCLDATKRQVVQDIKIYVNKQDIQMEIHCNQDYMPEQYQTEKQKKHLEKAIQRNINLEYICTSKEQ